MGPHLLAATNALATCVGSVRIGYVGFFHDIGAFREGMKNVHGKNLPHIHRDHWREQFHHNSLPSSIHLTHTDVLHASQPCLIQVG